ncbi:MAG: D-alanyl-D-alanine carboxypeptidase [Nitritalea sp.]
MAVLNRIFSPFQLLLASTFSLRLPGIRLGMGLLAAVALFITFGASAQRLTEKRVARLIEGSELLQEHFVGFLLQDEKGRVLYAQNRHRHFIPASNTKLFTLYTSKAVLGDSIPGIDYQVRGDSLLFWGTGDPSLLHPELDNGRVFRFLQESPYTLVYAHAPFEGLEPSPWRADLSPFPLYGQLAEVAFREGRLQVFPRPLASYLEPDSTYFPPEFRLRRSLDGRRLLLPAAGEPQGEFRQRLPFPDSPAFTAQLLADTLGRSVGLVQEARPAERKTLYSIPSDSLFRAMMLPSDNFLAEQLLLLVAHGIGEELRQQHALDFGLQHHYAGFPNPPLWVDGSGLSRFNLMTPESILRVLEQLENSVGGWEALKVFLPAGGQSGTLKNAYTLDEGEVFVWAKTGTLRHAHLQSGLLETRKGRKLRFVFMHNNFTRETAEVREEMVRLITELRRRY